MINIGDVVEVKWHGKSLVGVVVSSRPADAGDMILYLVHFNHLENGHDGLTIGHLQNNDNNWWYDEGKMTVVANALKMGDMVRIKDRDDCLPGVYAHYTDNMGVYESEVFTVSNINENGCAIYGGYHWEPQWLEVIKLPKLKRTPLGEYIPDVVESPSHYANRKIEVMEFITDTLESNESFDAYDGYQYGSIVKYASRAGLKVLGEHTPESAKLEDIKKLREHADRWIKHLENKC